MKKQGLLNSQLNALISRLGHTELFVIADCGLPVPRTVPVVDLAVCFGIPRFADVVRTVLDEVAIEGYIIAQESGDEVRSWLPEPTEEAPRDIVTHEELKKLVAGAQFVIRTGEATPYANVIFRCGVPF